MSEKRVVWVLGAGFSKPLGGPLMQELFTNGFDAGVRAKLAADEVGDPKSWALTFAHLRLLYGSEAIGEPNGRPWLGNAEQFLEYLDLAAGTLGPAAGEAIRDLLRIGSVFGYDHNRPDVFQTIAADARRYLACACHFFVETKAQIKQLERWSAYRRWAANLGPHDHVVTFNYDLVVERAGVGTQLTRLDPDLDQHDLSGVPTLSKMHGSVDWVVRNDALEVIEDPWMALEPDAPLLAIGMPGPGKTAAVNTLFDRQWRLAAANLSRATHVIFVGYRMPEGDVHALQWMLTALRSNANHPQIHIVLGLASDRDVNRLVGLFEWALPNAGVIVPEPLWAQDFLAVFDRNHLVERGTQARVHHARR